MKQFILIITLFVSSTLFAQTEDPNISGEAVIKTSAECGSCKERLENVLNYTKGVKFAELNVLDKTLNVHFNPKKITFEEIKKIISETGYDADEVKAIPDAVEKLPACCKPGGMK